MQTNCKQGDLAVVVTADNVANIGRIVRVIRPHSGRGKLAMRVPGAVWLAECSHQMTWNIGEKIIMRCKGPVPDHCLRPIRGNPSPDSVERSTSSPASAVGGEQ